jgi:hypothetical protein
MKLVDILNLVLDKYGEDRDAVRLETRREFPFGEGTPSPF